MGVARIRIALADMDHHVRSRLSMNMIACQESRILSVVRSGFLLWLLAVLLFDSRPAAAEVWRVSPKVSEYFHLLYPGAAKGRLHTPLVLVMPDFSRVEQVILPFAGVSGDPGIDQLIDILNGERLWESADTGILNERYQTAVTQLAEGTPLRFPLVVLVRLPTPHLESDPPMPSTRDESLEAALAAWVDERVGERGLLVVSLQPR